MRRNAVRQGCWKFQKKSVSDTLGLVRPFDRWFCAGPREEHLSSPAFFIGTLVIGSATSVVLPTQAVRPGAWERDNEMNTNITINGNVTINGDNNTIIDLSGITTFGELKKVLPSTGTCRVPGINQLRKKANVLLRRETDSGIIEIYDNGFFTFEECGRPTVYGVDRCERRETYTYSGKRVAGEEDPDFSPYPWEMILESAGTARLAHNSESREEYQEEISIDAPESENNIALSVRPEHEIREEEEAMAEWRKARIERLRHSMEKLTDRQREILTLYYVEEMTQEEIAAKLGVRQQSVLDVLNAGRKKMQKNF